MKKLLLLPLILFSYNLKAQWVTIPDANFAAFLHNNFPTCMNGNQLDTTCSEVINCTSITCEGDNISSIDGIQYFNQLENLSCGYNEIDDLSFLPGGLTSLDCSANPIYNLPNNLPASLFSLDCSGCGLQNLPDLPVSLVSLDCSNNYIDTIFSLPPNLSSLGCSFCHLYSLPALPASLSSLYCEDNYLSILPALPPVMYDLRLSGNANLSCMPPIQEVTCMPPFLSFDGTNIACLPNAIEHPGGIVPAIDYLPICDLYYNPNDCELMYNIKGQVKLDQDQNCTTSDSILLHGIEVKLTDINNNLLQQVYTNNKGEYLFDTDLGNFQTSIDTSLIPFSFLCPASGYFSSNIISSDSLDSNLDFKLKCKNLSNDLSVSSLINDSGIFRAVHDALVRVNAGDFAVQFGTSCISGFGGNLKLIINGEAEFTGIASGSLYPASITGDTLIWNISDWSTVNASSFHIKLKTDSFALLGSQVCITAIITSANPENNLFNNTLTHCFTIVNSYDPNIKEVYPDHVEQAGEWLTYTIHFQNTGSADAEHIKVTDNLDSNLDWSTFNLRGASHENITQVSNTTGIVVFNFPNINLADSFSNEPASHGWIQYRIKIKDGIALPFQIHNTASIYFDFNNHVITNDAIVTGSFEGVDDLQQINNTFITLYPNPATDKIIISCSKFITGDAIMINDLLGRRIFEQKINSNTTIIDLSELTNGFYIAEILNGNQMERRKFLKHN